MPISRPRLILHSDIVRAPNRTQGKDLILLELVIAQNTLLALLTLHVRDGEVVFHCGSLTAVERAGIVVAAGLLVFAAVAVGAQGAFAHDEFEEGLEGWNAGGDYDDVGFDAARWLVGIARCWKRDLLCPHNEICRSVWRRVSTLLGWRGRNAHRCSRTCLQGHSVGCS